MYTYFTDIRVKIHAKSMEEAIAKSRTIEEHILDHISHDDVFIKGIGIALTDRQKMVGDNDD